MPVWVIKDEDGSTIVDSDTVDVALAITVVEVYGVDTWDAASPTSGPKALGAWLTVALARKRGLPIKEAQDLILHMSLRQMSSMLEVNVDGAGK